jgi:hypothetical protein
MPQYYNLTGIQGTSNIIEMYTQTDIIMQGYFSLFFVVVVGVLITLVRLKKEDTLRNSLITGSFFSLMLSLVFLAANVVSTGVAKPGLYVFVPAVILVITASSKWLNRG